LMDVDIGYGVDGVSGYVDCVDVGRACRGVDVYVVISG